MRKYILYIIAVFLLNTISGQDWSTPDKGYFKAQKDIDKSVSAAYTRTMATINFAGHLYNFVNYREIGSGKIIIRKLTNDGGYKMDWSFKKFDDIKNLNNLGGYDWQPAPVVFKDQLYLFYGTSIINNYYNNITVSGSISYSVYNAGTDKWTNPIEIDKQYVLYGLVQGDKGYACGMSASVVDDKLCLVYTDGWGALQLKWTDDLTNWQSIAIGNTTINSIPGPIVNTTKNMYMQISTISSSFIDNGKKRAKIMIGFINDKYDAKVYEYYFDDNNDLKILSAKTISDDNNYSSIALAEGSVKGDPSSGKCIQAFLKLNEKDNGFIRYRIKRYQSIDNGKWTRQEYNLVKQNYQWASKDVNLTAAVFPVQDENDIRQFMCLVYRGYDDWDYPLNCAWAETDRYVYKIPKAGEISSSQELSGPENTQYVGYIEGPPPFHLNNKDSLENPFMNVWFNPISELEFTTSSSSSSKEEVGFSIGGEVKFGPKVFKTELSYTFGKKWETELKKTKTFELDIHSEKEARGYYITFRPVITRAQYNLTDVNGKELDLVSYYYMSDPKIYLEPVELEHGLIPSDPKTYMNRDQLVNFSTYNTSKYGSTSNSWTGGIATSAGIEIEESKSMTNTHTAKLKFSAELGHIFDIGIESEFEYSLKTTTSTNNELKAVSQFNEPNPKSPDPEDVISLMYDIHWIKPLFKDGINNWWLHKGAKTQNTWCITYDVTYIKRVNGKEEKGISYQDERKDIGKVKIVSFTADENASGITLKWKTLNEVNYSGFTIERKTINNEWGKIGFVEGIGNKSKEYSFLDSNPLLGKIEYRLKLTNIDNITNYSQTLEIETTQQLPVEFSLSQNYPNPFNPTTKISYQIGKKSNSNGLGEFTKLVIYDILGKVVEVLVNENKEPGSYVVEWDASKFSAGIYFCRLQSGNFNAVKKLLLVK